MIRATKPAVLAATVLSAWSASARSQSVTTWNFNVTPYAWFAGLDGELGIRDYSTNIDADFSEVWNHLRFAAMAYGEARYGAPVIGLHVGYLSLCAVQS